MTNLREMTEEMRNESLAAIHQHLYKCTARGCEELQISAISFVIIATRMWLEELAELDAKQTSKLLLALSKHYDPDFESASPDELTDEAQSAILALFARHDFVTSEVQGRA